MLTKAALVIPPFAAAVTAIVWSRGASGAVVALLGLILIAAVLSAVHHAEVVALKVGEPFGSLVLAVSVTVIEVALIVALMSAGGEKAQTLARDTVFSAIMITCAGIIGASLLSATIRKPIVRFNSEGSGAALATVATLASFTLILPTFTTSTSGPTFTAGQLTFAAIASLSLYLLFVFVQTVRHRDYFLDAVGGPASHAKKPSTRVALTSLVLLLMALVAVVGLAKTTSVTIEKGVLAAGLPLSVVGVIIALVVLLPEGLAAIRAARRGRVQTSMNLAFGSAMASIGLTIPTIAVAQLWSPVQLSLGLGPTQIVLLAVTMFAAMLTVVPGRATLQQAGVHLVIFAAFLVVSLAP